jgi:hypothetical protein
MCSTVLYMFQTKFKRRCLCTKFYEIGKDRGGLVARLANNVMKLQYDSYTDNNECKEMK